MAEEIQWDAVKEKLVTILKTQEKRGDDKILTDPAHHFYGAVRNLLARLENGDEGQQSKDMVIVLRLLLGHLADPKVTQGDTGSVKTITLGKWFFFTSKLLLFRADDPQAPNILYESMADLLNITFKYHEKMQRTSQFGLPDPHLLAHHLGILEWDIPKNLNEAAKRALPYYIGLFRDLHGQSNELRPKENILVYAKEQLKSAIELLKGWKNDVTAKDLTDDEDAVAIFAGDFLLKKKLPTTCEQIALRLCDLLAESGTPWLSYHKWLYDDLYGGAEHRRRITQAHQISTYYSTELQIDLTFLTLVGAPNKTQNAKIPTPIFRGGTLFDRLCNLAGRTTLQLPPETLTDVEQFLFEAVFCKGRKLLKELNNGPFPKILMEEGYHKMLFKMSAEVLAEMYLIYKRSKPGVSVGELHKSYIRTTPLTKQDTPETVLIKLVDDWLRHANYRSGSFKEVVKKEEAEQLFLDSNRAPLEAIILKTLGSRPLLNLYAQLVQQVLVVLAPSWLQYLGQISAIIKMSHNSGSDETWIRALQNLFFEVTFLDFCISKLLAFPEELMIHADQLSKDHRFLGFVERQERRFEKVIDKLKSQDDIKDFLKAKIERLEEANVRVRDPKHTKEDLETVAQDLRDLREGKQHLDLVKKAEKLYYSYNFKILDVALRQERDVFEKIQLDFDDSRKNDALIMKNMVLGVDRLLPMFQAKVQMKPLPLLLITDGGKLERMILDTIATTRIHRKIPNLKPFDSFAGAVFLILCLIRRLKGLGIGQPTMENMCDLVAKKHRIRKAWALAEAKGPEIKQYMSRDPVLARWWDRIGKRFFSPLEIPRDWYMEISLHNLFGDPNVAFLVTLRKEIDCVEQWELNWIGAWGCKYLWDNKTDLKENIDPGFFALFQNFKKYLGTILKRIRVFEQKINQNKIYVPTEVGEKVIFDAIKEQAGDIEVGDKVYEWLANPHECYHAGEVELAARVLEKESPSDFEKLEPKKGQ